MINTNKKNLLGASLIFPRIFFRLMIFLLLCYVHTQAWSQKIKFTSGGRERNFILHLPKSYSTKDSSIYRIILCLHGKGSNGREMKMYTGLNKTGDEMNSIMAYPSTTDDVWPYADTAAIRIEASYLQEVITYITVHYKGDPDRVYMTGMSSGGIFTFTFASLYPSILKGIAVVSGNITLLAKSTLEKNAAVQPPLLLIHGTADQILYEGKPGICINAEDSFATYLSSCKNEVPLIEQMPDTHPGDKCNVEKIEFNCPEKMTYYRIKGGGHHWPGANFNAAYFTSLRLGHFCKDVKANDAIRDFILALEKIKTP